MAYHLLRDRLADFGGRGVPPILEEVPFSIIREIFPIERTDEAWLKKNYVISEELMDLPPRLWGIDTYEVKNLISKLRMQSAELIRRCGIYEQILLYKLKEAKGTTLCLVGSVGSGKSWALTYVLGGMSTERPHCARGEKACGRKRLIIIMDFGRDISLMMERDEKSAEKRFSEELANKMRAAINDLGLIDEREEIVDFWNQELGQLERDRYGSSAFSFIKSRVPRIESGRTADLKERKDLLAEIMKDNERHLDYMARLWRYVVRTRYGGKSGCAVIAIDNIDHLDPAIQMGILKVITSKAPIIEASCVVAMRPETFLRHVEYTGLVDMVPHCGPKPFAVMRHRLNTFLASHDWKSGSGLMPSEEASRLIKKINFLNDIIEADRHSVIQEFVNLLCGRNLRNVMLLGQSLLHLAWYPAEMRKMSPHSIARFFVRCGEVVFPAPDQRPVENIFRVYGLGGTSYLLKLRLLTTIIKLEERAEEPTIGKTLRILHGFGFSNEQVRLALNELMLKERQLVLSNSYNHYSTVELFNESLNDIIHTTDMGKAYANVLPFEYTYVIEVMVDCFMDTKAIEDPTTRLVKFTSLADKIRVLTTFLRQIHEVDVKEVKKFFQTWNVDTYIDWFGGMLLSARIVQSLEDQLVKITRARDGLSGSPECDAAMEGFRELVKEVSDENGKLFDRFL